MGAHRKYPPKNAVTLIQDLAASGHAIIGIAKHLGVSSHTFKRWLEEDDALQEAFESAGVKVVHRAARERCVVAV